MKTSELTGAQLDWAAGTANGEKLNVGFRNLTYTPKGKRTLYKYLPSTNWAQGGQIIEREKIRLDTTWNCEDGYWSARMDTVGGWWLGDTPLIAAMRAYVASKLGDEVEIPKELT
jgi:hypothetical protein